VTRLAALIFMVLALPPPLARLTGGHPPSPVPQLAALAPVAVVPATVAVIITTATARWLAVLVAIPAVILLVWQLPPLRRISYQAAAGPSCESGSALTMVKLRMLTVNAQGGAADPAALLRTVRTHSVDVLAVQELTPHMVSRLAAAGLGQLLPFSHLDPRPGSAGTGLWARRPLTPLPPVPGLTAAAPRARINPPGGRPVTLTAAAVHPLAPMRGQADIWQRELALIRGDATRHAPRSCAGLADSHGAHDSGHTTARYRSPWRAGRHRVHTGNLTVNKYSGWTAAC
jgi:endonuclease/exonuclease/phosphatase family protein